MFNRCHDFVPRCRFSRNCKFCRTVTSNLPISKLDGAKVYDFIPRYDHMVDMVQKILSEKPPDVVDNFEQYSWEVKQEKFRPNFDLLNDVYLSPPQLALVRTVDEMFRV